MFSKVNEVIKIHNGRSFNLVVENVTLSNGVTTTMDIIRHPGASAIVPLSGKNTVILIKQYRHTLGDFIWEIPTGSLKKDEQPLECAKRELREETGYTAFRWQTLGEIISIPAYSDARIHLFMATELEPVRQNLDHDELLDVHSVSLEDAIDMVYRGEIQDSKTISGLFLVFLRMKDFSNQSNNPTKGFQNGPV